MYKLQYENSEQLNNSRRIKILIHLVVWGGMIYFLNSRFLNLEWGPMSREKETLLIPLIVGMLINTVLFYSNAYWLIPRYLHTKQNKKYWKWNAFLLIGATLVELSFDTIYIFEAYIREEVPIASLTERYAIVIELIIMFGAMDFLVNILFWAMAFLYRMPKDWMRNERQKQQLVQDKLTAELDFLKAQINPHFLFNGINSIYHLMEEDVEKAQKILLRFSELLRYQLYECKEEFIPLKKELHYVSNYLEIETIRKGEDAIIKIDLPELIELDNDFIPKIAPLLFSPFLENAFKYLSLYSEREKNILEASLKVQKNSVHLFVKNTIDSMTQAKKKKSSSGIGLENVKRRLNILYPEKHQLNIREKEGFFLVDLEINLT